MAMNYSAWFGKLTAITGNPATVRILLTTIGAPENGSSIALVLTLIASSLEHIGKRFDLEVATHWANVARSAANAARTLAHEMPALTIFGPRCWRRFNIDYLCRLNFDQGLKPAFGMPTVDNYSW